MNNWQFPISLPSKKGETVRQIKNKKKQIKILDNSLDNWNKTRRSVFISRCPAERLGVSTPSSSTSALVVMPEHIAVNILRWLQVISKGVSSAVASLIYHRSIIRSNKKPQFKRPTYLFPVIWFLVFVLNPTQVSNMSWIIWQTWIKSL